MCLASAAARATAKNRIDHPMSSSLRARRVPERRFSAILKVLAAGHTAYPELQAANRKGAH